MNKDMKTIIYSLHPLERAVLSFLKEHNSLETLAEESQISYAECRTALQLLEQKNYVEISTVEKNFIVLDTYGEKFVQEGLPEIQVLEALGDEEKPISALGLDKGVIGSAMGELKKNNYIETRKEDELYLRATPEGKEFLSSHTNPLLELKNGVEESEMNENQQEIVKQFEQRKGFIKRQNVKSSSFSPTSLGEELVDYFNKHYKGLDLHENLTTDMLKSGEWKNKDFRYYDVNVPTSIPQIGRKHPMLEANDILSQAFLEMGFKEMKGPLVESAFWNMDVMWIPQDHPARDEQDTFYLEGQASIPETLASQVCNMHEKGIKHTHTSKGDFSTDISKKRLLRTHATATTFRLLKELGLKHEKGEYVNGKYFYLANVFRNEAIDATHLAEFYQGEGFIIGDSLSLADLMGFVKQYLEKLGYEGVRFKPTFNPYTEPSMEAHVYDPEIGKSYALINSGIFRPETLKPFGLENKTIIAWGFGASRIAAKLAGKTSMREITGITCDFEWLRTRPMMRKKVSMSGGDK